MLPADFKLSVLKTSSKPMSLLLKQFVSLTSATSFGSAKVMSTHYIEFFQISPSRFNDTLMMF